ncbi:MAG: helix-turn-helix domain-containing protein [Candidatus Methanomethylicaceae archaeon]
MASYFNISTRSVYRLIEEGHLFPVKIRNCLRVPVEEIRRFEREIREAD